MACVRGGDGEIIIGLVDIAMAMQSLNGGDGEALSDRARSHGSSPATGGAAPQAAPLYGLIT